jgi:HSP20 family molecular chaperone IbpA
MKMLESTRDHFGFSSLTNSNKDFDLDLPKMSLLDADELKVLEAGDKVELSLDTAGYKPDELKVTAGRGVVCVEGKHEEKTEGGVTMVSRQMSRQYPLPAQARPSDVVSNLSKDGILVVTVPKSKQIKQGEQDVPIEMNN